MAPPVDGPAPSRIEFGSSVMVADLYARRTPGSTRVKTKTIAPQREITTVGEAS